MTRPKRVPQQGDEMAQQTDSLAPLADIDEPDLSVPDEPSWIIHELSNADLGDERRTARLLQIALDMAARPSASLPEACGSPERAKAAYRFFSNEAVSADQILQSHILATTQRCAKVPLVLGLQDTTDLNWSSHPATEGLGPLANQYCQGLLAHTTLAITPDRVPLGLLDQQVWARDPEETGKRYSRKERPIEEKESFKWLESVEALNTASQSCPQTHFISVGDREADVYDLFVMQRNAGVDLLVRAAWDRRVEHPEKYLWDYVLSQPVQKTITLQLPRQGEKAARTATLEVRYCAVTVRPPKHRPSEGLPEVTLYAVSAIEPNPPAGVEGLEWLLLTTCPVTTIDEALEKLDWYAIRWNIELFHKILKSGCNIEKKKLGKADRLERCLSLYNVIAWRILYGTLLARALPDCPCTFLLEQAEWEALYCTIHQTPEPPKEPPTIRQAIRWIGQLGGFLGRKGDKDPGITVLWRGFQRLSDLTIMYCIMLKLFYSHVNAKEKQEKQRKSKKCG